jgi:tRNA (guanine37-N1)-methyltransferase
MRIDILTLFPAICEGALAESMMKRAREKHLADIRVHNLRDWARDKHQITDDAPYGGGQGMVMKPEPIFEAVESLRSPESKVILMSPAGRRFDQKTAAAHASASRHLIVVCGHYEGIDERVIEHLIDEEISIGDYVLTNGAIAALVFVDAVVRLIPGVLGDACSAAEDSFAHGLLEHPQYTRPVEYRGWRVPEILLSGHHAEIAKWRREKSIEKTKKTRPDLLP